MCKTAQIYKKLYNFAITFPKVGLLLHKYTQFSYDSTGNSEKMPERAHSHSCY